MSSVHTAVPVAAVIDPGSICPHCQGKFNGMAGVRSHISKAHQYESTQLKTEKLRARRAVAVSETAITASPAAGVIVSDDPMKEWIDAFRTM